MPGARILLVEDDQMLCELILRNLEARGHDVCIAEDAQMALSYLRATHFDLIFLDINLPDQTGWEMLRTARKEGWLAPLELKGRTGYLPVVVLSAVRVSPGRLQEFCPLAYLPKPFPMEAILRLAKEAAGRKNGEAVSEEGREEEAEHARVSWSFEEDFYA